MYIGIIMEYVTNVALVGIVVWIVIGRNLIGINIIATIGVSLIAGLESGRIIGLTGEYGQLIIEFRIVATILLVIAVLIMDREKEKKGMGRVGLIVLTALGMIILVDAEDLLTVNLAMKAQSLAFSFYTLAGLLGVIAVSSLAGWAVIPFGTRAVLADINIGILYLFAVSSFLGALRAKSKLVSGFHTEYSAVLFFLFFYICSLASMVVEAIAALNQSYIKRLLAYSAIAHVGYVLLALAVESYTSIFSLLVYMILYIIISITLLNLNLFSISKVNLVMQPITSTVSTSAITKALLYFKLRPYFAHLVFSAFSTFTVFLLSLAGIPPLSAFFGKWLVFSSAIHSQLYLLAIFGVLSSVISAFYYLRLIKLMYFQDSPFFHSTVLINSLFPLF